MKKRTSEWPGAEPEAKTDLEDAAEDSTDLKDAAEQLLLLRHPVKHSKPADGKPPEPL